VSTIIADLDPEADGTVRLPVPEELRGTRVRVTAASEIVAPPNASPETLRRREEAFQKLRRLNPFRDISDPAAWQKIIRTEHPLPGRERNGS